MNTDTGIYRIVSPSGKFYVGSARSFKNRWAAHIAKLRKGTHHSKPLQRAFDKYGEESMLFEKIALCPVTDLIVIEQRFIDRLRPEYNCSPTAGSILGMKLGPISEETRRKIGDANRGRKPSAETVSRIAEANRGKRRSKEFCRRMGELHRGKTIPAEMRIRISESLCGSRNANFGKPMSKEIKEKLSSAMSKSVMCVETSIIFKSWRAAAEWLHSNGHPTARNSHISSVCNGKLNRAYGYRWIFA